MTETQGCGATPSPIPPNAKAGANSLFLPCLWFGGEAFAARADAVGGVGWRSSRRQRPLATFRRPLAISFRRLTNRLGKVKNGRFSRWRFEL